MNALPVIRKVILVCTTVLFAFVFTSWKTGGSDSAKAIQDTVPDKPQKRFKDVDDALAELDHARADLDKTLKEIDWNTMQGDLKDAMKNLNSDLKNHSADLKKALQEIDVEKIKRDVEASTAMIDWDHVKAELQKVKEINLDSLKLNLEKLKPELEKNLQDAREQIEKAKSNMQEYQGFVNDLEQDGLIRQKDGYKIEHRNGQLLINGKQQSSGVTDKYRTFLEKNQKFTLEKTDGNLKINTN